MGKRSKILRRLKILAAAIIVVIIGVVIVVSTVDVNQYKDQLTQLVEESTGRKLHIGGKVKFKISIIPTMVVRDVRFANAKWGSKPDMLSLDKFEVQVALRPLLSGNIRIIRMILLEPEILLETNKQGIGNWVLPSKKTDEKTSSTTEVDTELPAIVFHEIYVKDAKITYRDGVTGKESKVLVERIVTDSDSFDGPVSLHMKFTHNDIPVQIRGSMGALKKLMANNKYPVDLAIAAGGAKIALRGQVAKPLQGKGLDLDLNFNVKSLSVLSKFTESELPAIEPVSLTAKISGGNKVFSIKSMKLQLGKADVSGYLTVNVSGKNPELGLNLDVKLLSELSRLVDTELPVLGPVNFTGKFSYGKNEVISIKPMKLQVGKTDFSGDITVNVSGKRPALTATLNSNTIDLLALFDDEPGSAKKEKTDRVFPSDPLPLEDLKSVDADVTISARQILTTKLKLENTRAVLSLKNGNLSVKPLNTRIAGGNLNGSLDLNASGKTISLVTDINIQGLEPSQLPDLKGNISGGKTDVKIMVKGRGNSVRQIMADLNGKLLINIRKAVIKDTEANDASGGVLLSIFRKLNPTTEDREGTQLNCGVANFYINDGIAITDKGIVLSTSKMNIFGSGTIDLKTEKLDIGITPEARKGIGLSVSQLANLMKLGGTLANPEAVADAKGALKAGASVGAAIATGGLSILVQGLFGRATADGDPCGTAIASKKPEESTRSKADDTVNMSSDPMTDQIRSRFK